MLRKRPMKLRIEMDMEGTRALRVYDGSKAWGVNLTVGQTEAAAMPEAAARTTRNQASLAGLLVDHRRLGAKIELADKVQEKEDTFWRLEVTLADGSQQSIFLGDVDYLVRKKVITTPLEQSEKLISTITLGDYREVGKVMIAHRQVTRGARVTETGDNRLSSAIPPVTITFSSFRVNEPIDDELFKMPQPKD